MESKLGNFLWVSCFALCTVCTSLLFVSFTANLYFSYGRYLIYLAFVVGAAALILIWYRSYKLAGWKNRSIPLLKSLVLVVVFCTSFAILAVSHSGI
jgi:hypothetical protein